MSNVEDLLLSRVRKGDSHNGAIIRTASLWQMYDIVRAGCPVANQTVLACVRMILMKIARSAVTPITDDFDDIIGYATLAKEALNEQIIAEPTR